MNKKMKSFLVASCLSVICAAAATAGDIGDAWITTKAKLALLTTDGLRVSAPNVDTVNGNITLHGKVATPAEKTRAEATVKTIDGVKHVNNLIQVVPVGEQKQVAKSDDDIRAKAKAALRADEPLSNVSVTSVNNGVVLLSGSTKTLDAKLQAVEKVYAVDGVEKVATQIEVVGD
jgi:osmotically-inducible protein OsmY